MIRKKLYRFADEADTETPGALDEPSCSMTRMPEALKEIKKKTVGRHRIYYTGTHHACRYEVVFIKAFKQTGKDDDDNRTFQGRLINILGAKVTADVIEVTSK